MVSIIVPAYNVEKYIEKCINSILNQTYKDIEIIVVNDGSTDSTGELLNAVSETDERVKVIHKDNAGVSVARNTGIDAAVGDYVVFVDGDDFLAPDYVEYMINLANKTKADFCISLDCFTQKGESQTEEEFVKELTPEEGTALLLSPRVIVGCWNKIFSRKLLEEKNIRFSTSLFYGEGLHFITKFAQLSNKIGVGNRKVYYYRRNNETSATTKFNIEKLYNGERSLNTIEENLLTESKKIYTMLKLHRSMFYLGAVVRIIGSNEKRQYYQDYKRWLAYIRRNIFTLFFEKDVPVYRKLLLSAGCIVPTLVAKLDVVRRARIARNSVTD